MSKKRKSITLDTKTIERIKALSSEQGKNFSNQVEELIRDRIDQMKDKPQKVLLQKKERIEKETEELLENREEVLEKLTNDCGIKYEDDGWANKVLKRKIQEFNSIIERNLKKHEEGEE